MYPCMPHGPRVLLACALAAALAGGTFACTDDQDLPTGPELAKGGNTPPLAVSPASAILSLAPVTTVTLTAREQGGLEVRVSVPAATGTRSPALTEVLDPA